MGMTNAPFGMYGGILVISIPELLNARHVSEATISTMTAIAISPGFWSIVASPMLDVRFSRRWYSVATATVAAVLLSLALLNLDNVALTEVLLVTGFFSANLYQSALGGWLSSIITPHERNRLSVWLSIANISGGGAMALVAGEAVQRLSAVAAAVSLGALLLVPIAVFPWIPAPGPDRRLASECQAVLVVYRRVGDGHIDVSWHQDGRVDRGPRYLLAGVGLGREKAVKGGVDGHGRTP